MLPWLVAEADGAADRQALRRLLSNGLAAGVVAGIAYVAVGAALWTIVPATLHLTAACFFVIAIFLFYKFLPNRKVDTFQILPAAIIAGVAAEIVKALNAQLQRLVPRPLRQNPQRSPPRPPAGRGLSQ